MEREGLVKRESPCCNPIHLYTQFCQHLVSLPDPLSTPARSATSLFAKRTKAREGLVKRDSQRFNPIQM